MDAVMPTYGRADLVVERGSGCELWDAGGRKYLDFTAGIAVTALGHCHPHLVAMLTEQAGRLWHCSNLFRIPGQERLARRLVDRSFADTVFFTNSGAEALECALKLARKYHHDIGRPERHRVVCFSGAFHGRTLATIAAGGQEKYTKGFEPVMPGFDHVPFGDIAALKAALGDETAAIMVEPIQGEGGIRVADPDWLRAVRALASDHGVLLILDEVQSGMGRTGHLFAHQAAGIVPDVMALAKGLGSGFPVGACLATAEAARGMTAGTHGSTFGGNPLAMAVANGVLDILLADGFLDHVQAMGAHLRQGLAAAAERHPAVLAGVRGVGLMMGVECVVSNGDLVAALREAGVLTVAAGDNVVRWLPPLIVETEQIDAALAALDHACSALSSKGTAR